MNLSAKRVIIGLMALTISVGIVLGGFEILRSVTGHGFFKVSSSGGVITLNPGIKHQTISGWETMAEAGEQDPTFPNFQDDLFDQAVNDLGINRIRLEVRAGVENPQDYWTQYKNGQIDDATWRCLRYSTVNDNSDPNVISPSGFQFSELDNVVTKIIIPLKQRLEARGEHLFINLEYVAFTNQIRGSGCSSFLQYIHDTPDEYAEVILAATLHLRDTYGVVPDAWEVILEPDNVPEWNGNLIGQAIVATAARLEQNGFTPSFIAPSTKNMSDASSYFDGILQVPGAVQYISELSYHRYRGVSTGALRNIVDRANQQGIGTAMLEHIGADYKELHQDLKLGDTSAWQQYTLAFPTKDNGAQYYWVDTSSPGSPRVVMGSRTRFLRQYFKFIRAGAQRIDATTTNGTFDPVSFINTDGRYVVVVKASSGGSFTVSGLPAGTYGIKYTTNNQYNVDLPDVTLGDGQLLNTSIPASGVVTVHAKRSSAPESGTSIHDRFSEVLPSGIPTLRPHSEGLPLESALQ